MADESSVLFNTKSEFLQSIRSKYPEYNTWNDADLYSGIISKYPVYESQIRENAEPTSPLVTEAKKAAPPSQWYGRPLSTPVEQLEGGSDYIKLRQKQNEGRQGFWESITPSAEDLPFVGAGLQAIDSGKVLKTANALGRGEDVDDQSLLDLNQFLLENDRRANATIVGKAGNIVLGSLTFGVELMGSIATLGGLGVEVGGMKSAMKAGQWAALKATERLAYDAADRGALMAVRHGVEKKVLDYVEKAGFKDLSKRMALKTADALVTSPIVGLANVVGAQGAQALVTTIAGEGPETQMANVRGIYKALDNKAEPYWESAIMGALQQWVEGSSEVLGGLLMEPYFAAGRYIGRAMPAVGQAASVFRQKMQGLSTLALQDGKQRIADFAARAPKVAGVASAIANFMEKHNVDGDTALKWFKKAGYNGVMGEFAEERYGGFLHGLFGTQGDEAGLANAFNQMIPTTADAVAEIMAFALPMQYVRGVNRLRGVLLGNKHGSIEHQFEDQQKAMTSANIVEAESARNTMGNYIVDMAEESLKNKNTHYSKTVNWLLDVAALPFTMSFSNTQYGNLDKLAFMEGAPAIVATLEGLQAELMRDVDGRKPMGAEEAMVVAKDYLKAVILDSYRRTIGVEPGSNEEKMLKAAEAAGVLRRTKRAVYVEVKEGETLDPELALVLGQHNIPVVKMSVADVEKGVGVKGVEYTVEEVQNILSIKDRASALKLLARFNLVGENTHQIPVNAVGADVLDALEKKILAPLRKVVEHQKKGSLTTLGSRYVKADGAEHIVTGLATDIADAQVTLKDAGTNVITHASLADLNDETKWMRAEHNIILTGAYSIVDTWDNIAKHLNEHDYTGVVPMPLLDARGEQRKNDKKEELWQFTLGARMDKATGKVYANINASSRHHLEDLEESLRFGANGNKLGKEADALIDKLTKAIVKEYPDIKKAPAGINHLLEVLDKNRKELYGKIGIHILTRYSRKYNFEELGLPYTEELELLGALLNQMPNGQAWLKEYEQEVAKYLRPGWVQHFMNPGAKENVDYVAPMAVKPSESIGVENKGAQARVKQEVKAAQKAEEELKAVEVKPVAVEAKPVAVEAKPVAVEAKPVAVEAKPVAVEVKPTIVKAKPVAKEVVEKKLGIVVSPVAKALPPDQLAVPMMPESMAEDVLTLDNEPVRGVALSTPKKVATKEVTEPVSTEIPKDTNITYSILQPDQYDAVSRIQKVILGKDPSEEETIYLFSRLMGAPLSDVLRWLANRELPENRLEDVEAEVGDIMGATEDQDAKEEQEEEIASETESLSIDNKMEDELSARDVIKILFDYRFKFKRGYREFKKLMDFYQSYVLKRMAALQKGEVPKSYALMVEDKATFDAWVTGKAVSDSEILLQNIAAEMGYEAFKAQMVLHLSRPVLLALRIVVEKDADGKETLRTAPENGLDLLPVFKQKATEKILGTAVKPFERWANMAVGLNSRVPGDPKDAGFKTLAAHISQWARRAASIKTPPEGAQEKYSSARIAGASDYEMGALSATLGISYFADWLSGIQAKYWEIARKNPKTASRLDNEAIRGLYKTIKVITESMSEDKRNLLKSENLPRAEQQRLFNKWMQKIESDVFNGIFVTGDVTYGVKSNVEKLALQQQSYRNPGADLDSQHETPGGRRATALRAYGPAVQQFEMAQINAVDDNSEDYKRLKTAQIVVLSGVENKLTDRGKDAQDLSTDDIDGSIDGKTKGYLERINVAEFIPEGKFFIRIQTGDKQQLVGVIANKFYTTSSHEMNYKAARKWIDTTTMGAASSWGNDPVKEGIRGGSFASRGLMWTPSTADGGIGTHMRVVVLNDPDKDFDGEILMTDAGYKSAKVSAPMGAAATTFKTLIAGVMNGMPLLFKGLFAPMSVSKQLRGFRTGISERVEAYNAKHPDKPIHAVVSSQTAKQWAYKVHDFGATEFEPSEIPLHMAFAQSNLDTAHDLHYIKTPIQLPADLQSTPAGPKLLEYLYEMQKEALDTMPDMPPMIDMVRTEMQDVLALLGREDIDAYKRAVEADDKATIDAIKTKTATREQSPYLTAIRDRLRSSKVVKTAIRAYDMRGFHGIALSAAGSDKVFDSDKVDEGYVGAIVSVNVAKDPGNPNNVRYATWYNSSNEDEVAADVARQVREDGQGFGADLVKRNADGSFIVPLDKVKPEHLRRHEFRQVEKRIMVPGSWVIINRTPGTGLESHILARLGDDPGEAAGNTVYLAKSVVLRAGVDFDGDKWAVFPLPLKNGRVDENAFETRFINAMVSAYDSLKLEDLHNAIDVNAMQRKDETFTANVKKILDIVKVKGMLDPSAWNIVDHMSWDAKKALGIFVSSLGMVQFGVTAGGLKLKVPTYPDSGEPSWDLRLMKDFYLTRLGDVDLNEWRTSDGFMRVLTGTLTNMIVDNPKQPQVNALGINNITVGMAVTALLFSEPVHNKDEADALVKKVTTWLKQPVVKHFASILQKSRSVDSYAFLKYKELKTALETAINADKNIKNKSAQLDMVDGVIQVGRYIANEFFALSRVVKIGQYPVADATEFEKLRKDFIRVIDNGFRNFDTTLLKDSATMKKAHVVMTALQQRVYNDKHLMHTPLFTNMMERVEASAEYLDTDNSHPATVRGAQPTIVVTSEKPKDAPRVKPEDMWKRMEVVRLVTAATQPDVNSPSYKVEMSDPRILGTHLVPIIQELQYLMPDNEFVTSLRARKYPIGVDIKYQGANLNTGTSTEQIIALQNAAEKIQDTNGWTKDQILRGLAVYVAWAYGTSLSSRSGNYVVALPTRINDIIAAQTQALTQSTLPEAQRIEAQRYIQGMYHAMGYRRYDVNWGLTRPKVKVDYSATGAAFKYEGRTEYKNVPVNTFYSKESTVDVAYVNGVININTAKVPKNNAAVEAMVEAAYQRSLEGRAPAAAVNEEQSEASEQARLDQEAADREVEEAMRRIEAQKVALVPKALVTPGPQEPEAPAETYSVLAPKEQESLINDVLDLMAHYNNKANRNLLAPGDRDNYARRIAMALRGDAAAMNFINDRTKAERKTSAKASEAMDKLWRYHKAAVNRKTDTGFTYSITLTQQERTDWMAYRSGEYEYPDESSVDVAKEQNVLYRGLNLATVDKVMRRNPDGSLTLFPQTNMDGQVTSVSATPYRFVAFDYATRDYAEGTSRHKTHEGLVLTIINPDLSKAESENAEEVSFPGEVTIPAGQWQLDSISEFPMTGKDQADIDDEIDVTPEDATAYDEYIAEAMMDHGPGEDFLSVYDIAKKRVARQQRTIDRFATVLTKYPDRITDRSFLRPSDKVSINRDIEARRQDLGENDPDREEPRPDIQYSITNVAKINGDMLKGLIGLGNLGLHSILMKETFAVEAMNYIEGMRYENLRVLYGRNGVVRDAKNNKVADMSADDLRMLQQFFWTVTALVEDPVIRKLLDKGATTAALETVAIKRGLIAYGSPIFNDIGKGRQVLFEQLPAGVKYTYFKYKNDVYKRITTKSTDFTTGEERAYVSYWNQSNNTKTDAKVFEKETIELPDAQPMETYAAFKARWKNSQAYKNLMKAGRTEAELDWTLRAREDAKFYKDVQKLAPYIKNRANYVLHIWGSGFPTLESQQAQDKLTTALKNVGDQSAAATWLPESTYQMEFKTPEKPAVLTEQKALYQQLTGLKVDLAGLTMWDLNSMLARELRARQYEIAVEIGNAYNPVEAINAKDLATIKRLEATVRGYKFKEWTARSMPRTLHGTYADIYSDETQRRHIMLPDGRKVSAPFRARNMDAMELRIQYMRDITAANMNRNLIHQYLLTPDYDGTPLVIAIPSAYVDEHPLIPDALYREMAQRWAKSIGKAINPNENIRGQLEALARDYGSNYEVQESPYPSVARFLVKKGDDTSALMKHVIQAHTKWMVGDHDMLEWLAFVTQLSKVSSVGWSLFFMMTNIETLIAGTGAKTNVLTNISKAWKDIHKVMKELLNADPSLAMMVAEMLEGRIDVSTTTAAGEARSAVDRAFARLHENVRLLWGEDAARRVSTGADVVFGRMFTNWFFGKPGEHAGLFPAFKIYTAKLWADTEAKRRKYDGIGDSRISKQERVEIYKSISGFINSALGASAPQLYTMQTPKYQQFSGLTLFAYKWTEAALQIFGAEKVFGALYGATMTKRSNELTALNAAMMVSLVLIGFPSLLQSIIWATAGGPEDHPFPIQNEEGRKTYVDITPWARMMPGYKGDPTGRRREYMRWGKQFYEVADGWLTEPYSQLMRKLSQPAKVVVEQITGRSPGSDWNLDFQGQGLKGWLLAERDDEISFINSRLGMVLQKFIPMSVLGGMKNPETALAGALAPLSKGMSMGRATAELIIIFNTAAHEGNWKEFKKFPDARANLEGLGAGILDAAARNGYDVSKIVNTAKGVVLSRLYRGFTAAMNNGDSATMDRISKQILRVGGTIKGLQKSMIQRKLMTGRPKELPAEELDAVEAAFGTPGALEPKK